MMMMTWSIFSMPCGSPGAGPVVPLAPEAPAHELSPPWACVQAAATSNVNAIAAAGRVRVRAGAMMGQESTRRPPVSPELDRFLGPAVYALGRRPQVRARADRAREETRTRWR